MRKKKITIWNDEKYLLYKKEMRFFKKYRVNKVIKKMNDIFEKVHEETYQKLYDKTAYVEYVMDGETKTERQKLSLNIKKVLKVDKLITQKLTEISFYTVFSIDAGGTLIKCGFDEKEMTMKEFFKYDGTTHVEAYRDELYLKVSNPKNKEKEND